MFQLYWPKLLQHKVKQRLTKMTQIRIRTRKLNLKTRSNLFLGVFDICYFDSQHCLSLFLFFCFSNQKGEDNDYGKEGYKERAKKRGKGFNSSTVGEGHTLFCLYACLTLASLRFSL